MDLTILPDLLTTVITCAMLVICLPVCTCATSEMRDMLRLSGKRESVYSWMYVQAVGCRRVLSFVYKARQGKCLLARRTSQMWVWMVAERTASSNETSPLFCRRQAFK